MSDFRASGTLVVESIEGAQAELEDEFSVSASAAASSGRSSEAGQRLTTAVDRLERGLDLDETRNDLLRELLDQGEDSQFQRARSGGGGLALAGAGLAAVAGTLGGLGSLLSDTTNNAGGFVPSPSDIIGTPAVISAVDVVSSAASLRPSDVVSSAASVATDAVIEDAAAPSAADIVESPVALSALDVISQGASVSASSLIASAARVTASDLIDSAVTIKVGDVLGPLPDISTDDILKGLGLAGGAAGGAAAGLLSGGSGGAGLGLPSAGRAGAAAPFSVGPQLALSANDLAGGSLLEPLQSQRRANSARRVEVTNNVQVERPSDSRSRGNDRDLIQQVAREVERTLEGQL